MMMPPTMRVLTPQLLWCTYCRAGEGRWAGERWGDKLLASKGYQQAVQRVHYGALIGLPYQPIQATLPATPQPA